GTMPPVHRRIGRIWVVAAARRGLIIGLLPTLVLGALLAPPAGSADQATIAANVGATPSGQPMGQGFVGVSLEFRAVHVYTGRDPDAVNSLLVRLLSALVSGLSTSVCIRCYSSEAT